MAADIATDLEEFIEREVTAGRFADRGAELEHALRLMQRDRDEAAAGIRAGLDDVKNGQMQPLETVFDRLRHSDVDPSG